MNTFLAVKRASKDNRDGLSVLHLKCNPADIPPEVKFGNYGDRYLLTVQPVEVHAFGQSSFEAQRVSLDDHGDGQVILRVAALPAQVGDELLYAPNGSLLEIECAAIFGGSAIVPLTPDHRRSTFKRLQVLMTEAPFWTFLENLDRWGLTSDPVPDANHRQAVALEIFCRLAQCHSRTDILNNAAACERTERLIRNYRSSQWQAPEPQKLREPFPLRIIAS